ncbi:MAG: hypothetical protein VBE63_25170 [Lamprobacter sp.]|uniref:hypothetical protein n=1 Tax=Lamprobacter sp. TaxID=3100796 RepID=UPI002B25C157|nr:hypothetical protein [Lamprobacter sp.]MEA3643204.1 hypothetical protein [Lamprobacter sp.]
MLRFPYGLANFQNLEALAFPACRLDHRLLERKNSKIKLSDNFTDFARLTGPPFTIYHHYNLTHKDWRDYCIIARLI